MQTQPVILTAAERRAGIALISVKVGDRLDNARFEGLDSALNGQVKESHIRWDVYLQLPRGWCSRTCV